MKNKIPFLVLLCYCTCLFADSSLTKSTPPPEPSTPPPSPWFTGSMISLTGYVIPYGHVTLQGYVYANVNTGLYNSHWDKVSTPNFYQVATQFYGYFGLTPWMDLLIIPQGVTNWTQGAQSVEFSDLPISLDFQLFDNNSDSYFPGIKFSVKETFPTGNYQRLNPNKLGTDLSGAGAFGTTASLFFYKIYNTNGSHFLSLNANISYTLNSLVSVHGFNAYGGGYGTHGKVSPGGITQAILSFEYSLSQNWVLAIDNVYTHTSKSHFFGTAGLDANGAPASVGLPSSDLIAFCPAIEYNFSATWGLVVGAYISAWGRNAAQFRNGIVEVAYNY